jgi:hypothetical protein
MHFILDMQVITLPSRMDDTNKTREESKERKGQKRNDKQWVSKIYIDMYLYRERLGGCLYDP